MKKYLIKCKISYCEATFKSANAVYAIDLLTKMVESYDPESSKDEAHFSMTVIEEEGETKEEF